MSSVSEPRTSILGTQELFIEAGSTINLTCLIHTGGQAMNGRHIYWNYNGKVGILVGLNPSITQRKYVVGSQQTFCYPFQKMKRCTCYPF